MPEIHPEPAAIVKADVAFERADFGESSPAVSPQNPPVAIGFAVYILLDGIDYQMTNGVWWV